MGDHSNRKKKHRHEEDSPTSSTPSQSPSESSHSEIHRHNRSRKRRRDTYNANLSLPNEETSAPRKRMIGPAKPSAELLAEAQEEMREEDSDSQQFIGPPPPAVATEAESTNEAERFEEITRIMGVEEDNNGYDVLGVNRNMASENMKKRYWKLSLMVHPDKCSHPQAHQAFVKLNKAFKDLQDPDKRKALDDKIKLKEEQEEMKADLQAMREAAQWRRLQGISMEGDDILLETPKRDEWMTTLPPERKPGRMPMCSTTFSKSSKEGRGDTSVWTDTPSDRALKAKMNYASKEQDTKRENADNAALVDQYNKAKRSKSLVEKHQEKGGSKSKKKAKQEEWEGNHPWKPWDREKDLKVRRQSVKLDAQNMSKGLSSRFSSGSFQRNFL
ncbi:PREDICTED: GPALPP motifs-containing protein 1-like [Ipomoea nil]|uniref:GPALPP motifs-containing protein 1-like n=1 Tax=Ipomoea nil TaxID=35883 RepID=UPI000900E620|nr:PREDICTED: GPALPP motifs-containing protein 1-like [Ipomoea nil]